MYRIREVDPHEDEVADTLAGLHRQAFFDSAEFDHGPSWLASHENDAGGLRRGYSVNASIQRSVSGLHLRLMRPLDSGAP